MLLWIYRLLFVPALLFFAPLYLGQMRRRGGYRNNFAHRFGALPRLPEKTPGRRRVWLQAVSVGEVLAVAPILEALRQEPEVEVFLTTTTSTGYQLAQERCVDHVMGCGYFPIDWAPFSARAWRRIAPDLVILTEGERWPEHLGQARRRGVPVVCVNARVSDRSFRRMRALRWIVSRLLRGITRFLAVTSEDAERFRELGFDAGSISVTGNIKLDVTIPELDAAARGTWREQLGLSEGEAVLLGSSTWPGEELALVAAWRRARAQGLSCQLLVVPRHAERRDEIEAELQAAGVSYHFRSRGPVVGRVDVVVADTTGELRQLTQLADVVFVGKSLSPHTQGQTPVEAAVLGRPILFGPGMGNFRAIADALVAAGAARIVADEEALSTQVIELVESEEQRAAMAAAGRAWHAANQGAVARTVAEIRNELGAPSLG